MLEANLHLCLLRVLSTVCVGVLDFFASWLPLRPHYFLTILLETHCPLNISCLGLNLLKYTLLYVVHSSNQIRTYFLKTEDVFKVLRALEQKGPFVFPGKLLPHRSKKTAALFQVCPLTAKVVPKTRHTSKWL